jgi:uncharacterized protein YbjT (DUF2867 family)
MKPFITDFLELRVNKILVLGAYGTVGTALVQALQAQGQAVAKATSRTSQGAEQVHLNLLTGEGLATAFSGVDRAFLLSPPGHVNQDELLGPVIQAARQHGLKKVVLMSAMGADADEAAPLRKAERLLEASGLAWNVIRPNWFMQNFNSYWLHGILNQGAILLPTGTARGSFIDARDIADVAAALLTGHAHDNLAFDLTGPQALDHTQVAAILSQETGRAIGYQDITPEAMRAGLLGAGLPAPYVEFMLLILGFFKAGYAERTTDAVQQITGRAPRSLQQYARDYRGSWLA